jgi:hypothetical protein
MGWLAPRPGRFTPQEGDPAPIVQEAGWAPGPVWTAAENLGTLVKVLINFRVPDAIFAILSNFCLCTTDNKYCYKASRLYKDPLLSRNTLVLVSR